jgi:hypothetical protein
MPTQPFIYNPVFMVPPQVNNFNNEISPAPRGGVS